MSKDIIVLTPNGRRQKVHCTPDTTILQILEDACAKHGFQPVDYDLKHHNHLLDLTTTIRFSNLPNKATLEMVEAERKREEKIVTIGLLLEDGERRTADFPPNTSLYELIFSLAPSELNNLQNPTVMYMRQEVIGLSALREKTLRQLGLLGGRAILRLLNKAEEARQANVSAVYHLPITSDKAAKEQDYEATEHQEPKSYNESYGPGPSTMPAKRADYKLADPVSLIKEMKKGHSEDQKPKAANNESKTSKVKEQVIPMNIDSKPPTPASTSTTSLVTQENLERRLKIEEEVTFLGAQKAIAFMHPDEKQEELSDLPDDFYELTIEEVRKLYKDLQQNRMELENTPLLTSEKRGDVENQTSEQKLAGYKNVVVRVQFPDEIILQGIFLPSNTIGDINNFVMEHLNEPNRPFHILTTPLKQALDPEKTLLEAGFVPCVHMHFKWLNDTGSHISQYYLKPEIYLKQTSSDAASMLASKYRAPNRRKMDDSTSRRSAAGSSSAKMPKWFKR